MRKASPWPSPTWARRRARPRVTTPVYRAPKRFDLVGLHWRSGSGTVVCGSAATAAIGRGGSRPPAPTTPPRTVSAHPLGAHPVWVGGADERADEGQAAPCAACARSSRTPPGRRPRSSRQDRCSQGRALRLRSRPSPPPTPAPRAPAGGRHDHPPLPTGAPSSARPAARPNYGTIKAAFIHHTCQRERLRGRGLRRDGPGHLPLPPQFQRLGRHRLQLPRRPLRPDLRGPRGRRRAGGAGRPAPGLQRPGLPVSNLGTFSDVAADRCRAQVDRPR